MEATVTSLAASSSTVPVTDASQSSVTSTETKNPIKSKRVSNGKSNVSQAVIPTFKCETCAKIFKSEKYLKAHNDSKHGIILVTFKCECDKTFSAKSSLKNHFLVQHGTILSKDECKKYEVTTVNTVQSKYWYSTHTKVCGSSQSVIGSQIH